MSDPPTIYNFDPADGAYTGSSAADPSPLEPGVWLHPAWSTTTEPPAAGPHQTPVFVAGAWALVADHRGETWYEENGAPVVIWSIGDPTTAGLSPTKPAPPADPVPAPPAPAPIPACQLWQLQAVLTAVQWAAVTAAVAALANPAVSAFFAHGANVIPANSTTLAALAVAIGVDPATLPELIQQASQISIP